MAMRILAIAALTCVICIADLARAQESPPENTAAASDATAPAEPNAAPAPSAPTDPYYVQGIEESEEAENGEKAMEKAVAKGQRKAFGALLQTLGYTDAEQIASRFDDGAVGAAVTEMDVSGERVGAKHYKATFAFKFRPEAVRAMLSGAGVPPPPSAEQWQNDYSDYRRDSYETSRPSIVLLPIFEDVTGILQWDSDNIWQRVWHGAAMASRRAATPPLEAPVLHPLFLEDIRNDMLAPEDISRIREGLAAFVPAGDMIVALGEFSDDPQDPQGTIILHMARVSPTFSPIFRDKYLPQPGERFENFVGRIVRAAFDRLQMGQGAGSVYGSDVWGAPAQEEDAYVYDPANGAAPNADAYAAGCGNAPEQTVSLIVPAHDLKEWVETENRLRASPGVVFVQPLNLVPGHMTISLIHRCGDNLAQSLSQSGLAFNPATATVSLAGYSRQ